MNQLKDPVPLQQEKHSLESDMLFGWRPKDKAQHSPIPLSYSNEANAKPGPSQHEIYNGPRPVNSYMLHKQFQSLAAYNFNYADSMASAWEYLAHKHERKQRHKRSFTGPLASADLLFDSKFEGGNLDKVIQTEDQQYNLYLRVDTNHTRPPIWFYFSVRNFSGPRHVKLNIVNIHKNIRGYQLGMKPVVSRKNYQWEPL